MREITHLCRKCGGPFESVRAEARYCSCRCAARDRHIKPHASYQCRKCRSLFIPKRPDRTVYCSRECAFADKRANAKRPPRCRVQYDSWGGHRKRARRHDVAYEPINRLMVFDRDGWHCQVCGSATPRRLMGGISPFAPELDHRIPMALSGGHVYENVQCACRRCNLEKGGVAVRGQMTMFPHPKGERKSPTSAA